MMGKASKNLGILGIVISLLSPFIGIILGIIGLSIQKEEGHQDRDTVLNILAIGVGVLMWFIGLAFWSV